MRIKEIFCSLQGEAADQGIPTVFVRLAGCPLACSWCDTDFSGGEDMSPQDIALEVLSHQIPHVCVTGGEPLPAANKIIEDLCDWGLSVSVETSGAATIRDVDVRARIVMDIKCPASGMSERNRWRNLLLLKRGDEVKFVIADRADFEWAIRKMGEFGLEWPIFSPADPTLDPKALARWILDDRLRVRMQVQLHKIVGLR